MDRIDDLISREAVIDLLKQLRKDGMLIPWEGKDVFKAIRRLPSAQPEQKWIPFEQKLNKETRLYEWSSPLPEEKQHILVSIEMEGHETVQDDYFDYDGWGVCYLDSGYGIAEEAVAWMPLPEPFKAMSGKGSGEL